MISLIAAACGGTPDQTIDITYPYCAPLSVAPPSDVTAQEETSIEDALAMWNALGLTQLQLPDGSDMPRVPIEFQGSALGYGLYQDEIGTVIINRDLTDERQRAITVAHELGHAFGLVHVPKDERVSVMNPANLTEPPNASDANALKALACGQ